MEPCQLGGLLAYARSQGQALRECALQLPTDWTHDDARWQSAGVPETQPFATQPPLARPLLPRAFDAQVPAAWVTGASVQGDARRLRRWLEARAQAYGLAVSGKAQVGRGWRQHQVNTVWATLPPDGWPRRSAGAGPTGRRWYAWRWLPLAHPRLPAWRRWLLVRRSVSAPTDLTAYVVLAPHASSLEAVVRVAGSRWTVESGFAEAKGEVGLAQDAVRSWTGWQRHIPLAMGAYALLTVLRAAHLPPEEPKNTRRPSHPSSLATFKATRGLACR